MYGPCPVFFSNKTKQNKTNNNKTKQNETKTGFPYLLSGVYMSDLDPVTRTFVG